MTETFEVYNKENDYYTKDGQIYTYDKVRKDYPAVDYAKLVFMLYGRTVLKVQTFDYLRGINRIKSDVSDEEALSQIAHAEMVKATESTELERIASALEFLELVNM